MGVEANVTQILGAIGQGDRSSAKDLMPLVYKELRALAGSFFAAQRANHTLQPTALVHEAYARLVGHTPVDWRSRSHFFETGATAMRQILIDHSRQKKAAKRGGDWQRVTLSGVAPDEDVDFILLNDALNELALLDKRQARVVELRFFGGLTVEETAHVLGVSARTVDKDWRIARLWLLEAMDGAEEKRNGPGEV